MDNNVTTRDGLKEKIREKYASAARAITPNSEQVKSSCCCNDDASDQITSDLYDSSQLKGLPKEAIEASLGCGNPTALANLKSGEDVLDLGSGGGIDALLAAGRVGPDGRVYGVDMTDEMMELARRNQDATGIDNVEFIKGDIENIPLPDASVDVIISNCVINLAESKDKVLKEAYRVLRPGGRLSVSDIVFQGDTSLIPSEVRRSAEAWAGCVAGALGDLEWQERLADAGFTAISVEASPISKAIPLKDTTAELPEGVRLASAFISALRPDGRPAEPLDA